MGFHPISFEGTSDFTVSVRRNNALSLVARRAVFRNNIFHRSNQSTSPHLNPRLLLQPTARRFRFAWRARIKDLERLTGRQVVAGSVNHQVLWECPVGMGIGIDDRMAPRCWSPHCPFCWGKTVMTIYDKVSYLMGFTTIKASMHGYAQDRLPAVSHFRASTGCSDAVVAGTCAKSSFVARTIPLTGIFLKTGDPPASFALKEYIKKRRRGREFESLGADAWVEMLTPRVYKKNILRFELCQLLIFRGNVPDNFPETNRMYRRDRASRRSLLRAVGSVFHYPRWQLHYKHVDLFATWALARKGLRTFAEGGECCKQKLYGEAIRPNCQGATKTK